MLFSKVYKIIITTLFADKYKLIDFNCNMEIYYFLHLTVTSNYLLIIRRLSSEPVVEFTISSNTLYYSITLRCYK